MYALMFKDIEGFKLLYTDQGQAFVFDSLSLAESAVIDQKALLGDKLAPVIKFKRTHFGIRKEMYTVPNPLQDFQRQNIKQMINTLHVSTVKVI